MALFCQTATQTGGVRIGNKARVFKVEKIRLPIEKHPIELRGMTGYQFYYVDEHAQRVRELSVESGPHSTDYWMRIDDLAQDIATLLDNMRSRDETAVAQASAADSEPPIYLAETSSDLAA